MSEIEKNETQSTHKPVLTLILIIFGIIAIAVLVSAIMDLRKAQGSDAQNSIANKITSKIYLCNDIGKNNLDFTFMAFYNDNTFRGVYNKWNYNKNTGARTDNYITTYGTYTVDENALTLNISDKSYSCVIVDDGKRILIGNIEWIDYSDGTYSDEFLKAIGQ